MKTVIFGKGRVGEATEMTLKTDADFHDPGKGLVIQAFKEYDLAISCVSSLVDGPSDYDALLDNMRLLDSDGFKGLFVVRCTVAPIFFKIAKSLYPNIRIIHFPEFMRQQEEAKMDTPWVLVLGGDEQETVPFGQWLVSKGYGTSDLLHFTNTDESCLIKLHQNAGLAIKVIFGNLMFEMCKTYGADYEKVLKGVGADARVSPAHMTVPGEHGFGFAGHCLPKDVKCLNTVGHSRGFWDKVLEINEGLRKKNDHGHYDAQRGVGLNVG
jgi:UDP-glucose 6-dehydrogenase